MAAGIRSAASCMLIFVLPCTGPVAADTDYGGDMALIQDTTPSRQRGKPCRKCKTG